MKNTLKVCFEKSQIVMDRTFAKRCENTNSEEYARLQQVRKDYPNFTVVRREISKNPNSEHYKGLTYEYMVKYILAHGTDDERKNNLAEFHEKQLIASCHDRSRRYPAIKSWFLEKYPEIAEFGFEAA